MYTFYTYHFVYEYTFCVFDAGAGTHSSMRRTTFSTTCYRFTTYHYGIYLFHFFIFFFFAGADTHSSMRRTTFSTTCYGRPSRRHVGQFLPRTVGQFLLTRRWRRWEERVHAQATARQVPTGGALGSYGCMQVVCWVWRGAALALRTSALVVPAGCLQMHSVLGVEKRASRLLRTQTSTVSSHLMSMWWFYLVSQMLSRLSRSIQFYLI